MLLLLVVFASVNVAVLVLRRDQVSHSHFRIPSVVPALGLLSCLGLATRVEAATWRLGVPLLAAGAVLAAVASRRARTPSGNR